MPRRRQPTELLDNTTARKTAEEMQARKEVEELLAQIPCGLKCPSDVTGYARKEWERIVTLNEISPIKFINEFDTSTLRKLCDSVERYTRAYNTWAKKHKKVVVSSKENIQKSIDRCLYEMSRAGNEEAFYARMLNITPTERQKIAELINKSNKGKSELEQLMDE